MATVPAVPATEGQSVVLAPISWQFYESMLRELGDRRIRLTYDGGSLEIMSPSRRHEKYGEIVDKFLTELTTGLNLPLESGGMMTVKKPDLNKGLEPDKCYWIQHEEQMRGKLEFDPTIDPPPDLAVEIEIARSSLNRLKIYEALGVGEMWRFNGQALTLYRRQRGKLVEANRSAAFPFLDLGVVVRFLELSEKMRQTDLILQMREWVQEKYAGQVPEPEKKRPRRPPKK